MIDPQVAVDKLMTADTPDELRDYFRGEGIKGIRGNGNVCPIAVWLRQTTGISYVGVASEIKVGDCNFDHSEATMDFIEMFDGGRYPELEAPTDRVSFSKFFGIGRE